jgi:hypothetical protein
VPVAVPPGVAITTFTAPTAWAGVVAEISVELSTVIPVAEVPANVTAVTPLKLEPEIRTLVPPALEPVLGLMLMKVGAAKYVYALVPLPVPPAVVTDTFTAPAALAGVVAVIEVLLTTVKLVAAVPPKVTDVAPLKLVPVIVTDVPPEAGPELALTLVTVGGDTNVNAELRVPVPLGVVTCMLEVAAECAGDIAVIEVALTTVKAEAVVPPNATDVAPVKLVPVIVTVVPPVVGPEFGLMLVTVGTATYV